MTRSLNAERQDHLAECLRRFVAERFDGSVMRCAAKAGVDRSGLHRWTRGEATPHVAALAKLAAIGFDLNDALGYEPWEKGK